MLTWQENIPIMQLFLNMLFYDPSKKPKTLQNKRGGGKVSNQGIILSLNCPQETNVSE